MRHNVPLLAFNFSIHQWHDCDVFVALDCTVLGRLGLVERDLSHWLFMSDAQLDVWSELVKFVILLDLVEHLFNIGRVIQIQDFLFLVKYREPVATL